MEIKYKKRKKKEEKRKKPIILYRELPRAKKIIGSRSRIILMMVITTIFMGWEM